MANVKDLIVNGESRFVDKVYASNGVVGDLEGTANKAKKIVDSNDGSDLTVTYSKAGQASTSWLASWNGHELGSISPSNITAGNASKVNNLTVQTAVPANAKFTDTVTTVSTSGSGNAVTGITANNGALTVTKGSTFLTSHQDISQVMKNRTAGIGNTTDFNTLVDSGTYKIQMSSWGAAATYHGPNEWSSTLYSFGLLLVIRADTSDGEKRITQIYFPHNTNDTSHPVLMRMHNSSDMAAGWQAWHRLSENTNTWRGIQNNLTSDSTTDSLSAAQGKALANGSARDNTKLPTAGGTMTGDISFVSIGTWPADTDEKYPITSKGLYWNGSSDYAKIFYRIDGADNGNLIVNTGDASDESVIFTSGSTDSVKLTVGNRLFYPTVTNKGSIGTSSYKWADMYATTFHGVLDGNASSASMLKNYYSVRPTSANIENKTINGPVYFVASSSMTTGKPPVDAGVLTLPWDTETGWGAQFAIGNNANPSMYFRGSTNGDNNASVWDTTWKTVVDSSNVSSYALTAAGGTLTGALNLANNTWNLIGDDAYLGDYNQAGKVGIKGKNGATGLYFAPYSGSTAQSMSIDGAGTMTITGTVASTFKGDLTGNASSATKLATARSIGLSNLLTGSANFDGSGNISVSSYYYGCSSTVGNKNNWPFARIGHTEGAGSWVDKAILLIINAKYNDGPFGICRVSLRSNDQNDTTSGYTYCNCEAKWLVRYGFALDTIQIGIMNTKGNWSADIFLKHTGAYQSITVNVIDGGGRGGNDARCWTLINSSEVNDTTATDKKTSVERYQTIASYKTYSYVRTGSDVGTVANAGTVNGLTVQTAVPANAKFTDTTYNFAGTTFNSGNKDTSEHNANNMIKNGNYYYTSNGPSTTLGATTADGAIYAQAHSDNWVGQIAQDYRDGTLFVRGKNNGTWQNWLSIPYSTSGQFTVEKSVPSNAVFTDTNTWRGIQNNLTSDSTTDSLSAAQGKALKGLVDGKQASGYYMTAAERTSGDIDALAAAVRYTSGGSGSISLTKKASGTGSEIPAGWYNYFYSPHRVGTNTGDNGDYGTLIITPMTFDGSTFIVRCNKGAAANVKKIDPNTDNDTKNTAGSTNTASKIYLIGATSQAANPQTYSSKYVSVTNDKLSITDAGTGTAILSTSGLSIGNADGVSIDIDKYSFSQASGAFTASKTAQTSFTVKCPNISSVSKCLITFWTTGGTATTKPTIDSFTFMMEVTTTASGSTQVGRTGTTNGSVQINRSYDAQGNITVYIPALPEASSIRWKAMWFPVSTWTA